MKNKYDIYEENYEYSDKFNIACGIIKEVEDIPIEQDPNRLKDMIDMDLRENVPPQLYELISCVVEMIEKAERA